MEGRAAAKTIVWDIQRRDEGGESDSEGTFPSFLEDEDKGRGGGKYFQTCKTIAIALST